MADTDTTTQRPSEYHAKLSKLAGSYEADEKIHPGPSDPKGGSAKGRMTARLDLGGFWLLMDYEQQREGQVGFRGHGIFGYDPDRRQYCLFWVSSVSPVTDPMWGQYEGNTLIFQSQNPKVGWNRCSYHFNTDHSHDLKIERSQDGVDWTPMLEGHYRRK